MFLMSLMCGRLRLQAGHGQLNLAAVAKLHKLRRNAALYFRDRRILHKRRTSVSHADRICGVTSGGN
jgi:hypothetical protein